jgi:glucan biosynthesis protein C
MQSGPVGSITKSSRLVYIDNLRSMVITFVVMIHVGVTYSGMGMWYYKENQNVDMASMVFFGVFLSFVQAFSMGLLFMFAGYFIPGTLERKGPGRFVKDRLFRLGVPVLVFMFLLHPLSVAISSPGMDMVRYFTRGIRTLEFLSWSGPLWFALALLIFTLVYVLIDLLAIRGIRARRHGGSGGRASRTLAAAVRLFSIVLIITAVAFALRTVFPLGTSVVNMQLGYFSSYMVMFVLGIVWYRSGFLDRIDARTGKRWLIASFAVGMPLWMLIMMLGGIPQVIVLINGGLNWPAAAFALWESFFCVAVTVGLIGIFRARFSAGRPAARFLSQQAFGVYVFHAPILVAVAMSLRGALFHPLLKFAVVSILAVTACYTFSYAIRRIGFLRRVFS